MYKEFTHRKPLEENLTRNELYKLDTVVVHESASWGTPVGDCNYHMDVKGWTWYGYGFVIYRGKTYKVRGYEFKNAGVWGHNYHTINICVIGDYGISAPTEKNMAALQELIYYLFDNKDLPNLQHIKGHREYNRPKFTQYNTTCPRLIPYETLKKEREDDMSREKYTELKKLIEDLQKELVDVKKEVKKNYVLFRRSDLNIYKSLRKCVRKPRNTNK